MQCSRLKPDAVGPVQIGLLEGTEQLAGSFRCLSGVEFDELDASGQAHAAGNMALFSRVEPSHKTALVDLLKSQVLTQSIDHLI